MVDAGTSPVAMPGVDLSPPSLASGPSPTFGFGPTYEDKHAGPSASDDAPETQDAGTLSQLCVCLSCVACTTDSDWLKRISVRFMHCL